MRKPVLTMFARAALALPAGAGDMVDTLPAAQAFATSAGAVGPSDRKENQ